MCRRKYMQRLVLITIGIGVPSTAHAYIDPGMGSLILQTITATVIGGLVAMKLYWTKVVLIFQKILGRSAKTLENTDEK